MSSHPSFGHSRRFDFLLAEGIDHLNHGGYGATPRVVLDAVRQWQARIEADPTTFFRRDLPGLLRGTADRVAVLLGGRGCDWAFVENATAGLNAVIASLRLRPGDEILCLSQVYGAIGNALHYHAVRAGARIVTIDVPVPFTDPAPLLAAVEAAIGLRTRLACFDHLTSAGAVVLPIAEMAAICRAHGVAVAVDGAHAPGQLPLDVPALGVDWYVGNLHKWTFAAKGTAVIWCLREREMETHPCAISHALGDGFVAEFDYTGTRDNSGWLATAAALDYLETLGPAAMREHNRALAGEAGTMLVDAWESETAAAPRFSAAMASVRLPGRRDASREAARRLAAELHEKHRITAGVMALDGCLWIRVSAQIYNEICDYERLANIGKAMARRRSF